MSDSLSKDDVCSMMSNNSGNRMFEPDYPPTKKKKSYSFNYGFFFVKLG